MKLSIYENRLVKIAETKATFHASRHISSSSEAKEFCEIQLAPYFADRLHQEEFGVVTLDTKNKVTGYHQCTLGTLDASLVHPRDVFRPAIVNCASSIILVHNHPSGDPTPSRVDFAVTDRLKKAGDLLGINILDHIVIGDGRTVSIEEAR